MRNAKRGMRNVGAGAAATAQTHLSLDAKLAPGRVRPMAD